MARLRTTPSRGSGQLRRTDDGGGDQQATEAVIGHHFGFAETGDAGADGAGSHQAARDLRTLVRLGVRAKRLAAIAQEAGHAVDVPLEAIEIERQRRRRHVIAEGHRDYPFALAM